MSIWNGEKVDRIALNDALTPIWNEAGLEDEEHDDALNDLVHTVADRIEKAVADGIEKEAGVTPTEPDRFWSTELDPESVPEHKAALGTFGPDTVGIVDEEQGGIIAYVHRSNADRILDALTQA